MTLVVPFSLVVAAAKANSDRRVSFNAKKNDPGYRGPIIVAEGDSWFCYPREFPLMPAGSPKDLILWLQEEFAILNVAVPGALALQYKNEFYGYGDGLGGLHGELTYHQPDVLLLSGGGNDLLGNIKAHIHGGNIPLDQYLTGGFTQLVDTIVADLEWVADRSVEAVTRTDLAIIFNGYDLGAPGAGGNWIEGPMTELLIPKAKHSKIVARMITLFNKRLKEMTLRLRQKHGATAKRFVVAKTVGATGTNPWYDEIHPNSAGFKGVSKSFRAAILAAVPLVA